MIDEAFRAIPRTLPAIDGFGNRRISGAAAGNAEGAAHSRAAGAAPHRRAQQRSPVPGCRGNTYTVRRRASGVILRPPARPRHRRADAAFVAARGAGRVVGMRRCGAPAVRHRAPKKSPTREKGSLGSARDLFALAGLDLSLSHRVPYRFLALGCLLLNDDIIALHYRLGDDRLLACARHLHCLVFERLIG
jgi:hypothetical protein